MIVFAMMMLQCSYAPRSRILSWSIIQNDMDKITRRLKEGANPNGVASDPYTPLMLAAFTNNTNMMDTLLAAGADVNLQTKNGITALMIACANNNLDATNKIILKSPKFDAKDSKGHDAAWFASFLSSETIVNLFKAAQIKVNDESKIDSVRSTEEILSVLSAKSIGLKVLYDKSLNGKPGFYGKITMKFSIAPSGKIIEIKKLKSTTKNEIFDAGVIEYAKGFEFPKINSKANDIVTVPFTFSE